MSLDRPKFLPDPTALLGGLLIIFLTVTIGNSYAFTITSTPLQPYPGFTGQSQSILIGVQLSETCIKELENNATTNCLTYDKLKQFDTSLDMFSGGWTTIPYYHRLPPQIANSYQYYSNPTTVMVDPDTQFQRYAKMIIVQPDNFTWVNTSDYVSNTVRVEHNNLYIDPYCHDAKVAPILDLVNQAIKYMENGCTGSTAYNGTKVYHRGLVAYNIDNSVWLKYHNWLVANGNFTKDCIHFKCHTIEDPWHNHGKPFGW